METQLKNSFFTLSFVSTVLSCIWNLICGVLDLIASSVLTSTGLATSKTDDGLNLALAQLQETFMNTNNNNTNNQENNISPQVSVKLENECEQAPSMTESPVEVKFIEEVAHQEFISKIEQSLNAIPTSTSSGSSLASSIDEDSENEEEDDLFHDSELAFPDDKADPEANVEVKEKAKKKRRRGKKKSQKLREQIAREREALIAAGLNPDDVQIPSLSSSTEQISPRSVTVTAVKPQTPEKKQPATKKQPQSPTKQSKKDKESKSIQGKSDSLKWEKDASRKFSHSALKHDKMEEKAELNGDKDVKIARQPIGPSLGNNGFSADYQKSRRVFVRN